MTSFRVGPVSVEIVPEVGVVAVSDEGATITAALVAEVLELASKHFEGPFGLIADRSTDQDHEFNLHVTVDAFPQLCAMVVISHRNSTSAVARAQFSMLKNKHFAIFENRAEAITWVRKRVAEAEAIWTAGHSDRYP